MKIPLFCLLENIRSLHNVGSIFRCSDGAGVEKLYLTGYTGTPPRNEITKTALGAEKEVPWEHFKDPTVPILKMKQEGIQIVALETGKTAISLFDFKPRWPICFLLGNEVEGLSKEVLELTDEVVKIPMMGIKESLNVSCAYSTAVYEALRKYLNDQE